LFGLLSHAGCQAQFEHAPLVGTAGYYAPRDMALMAVISTSTAWVEAVFGTRFLHIDDRGLAVGAVDALGGPRPSSWRTSASCVEAPAEQLGTSSTCDAVCLQRVNRGSAPGS
jgi:hypothetical protein